MSVNLPPVAAVSPAASAAVVLVMSFEQVAKFVC